MLWYNWFLDHIPQERMESKKTNKHHRKPVWPLSLMAYTVVPALPLPCSGDMMYSMDHPLHVWGTGRWAAPRDLSWRCPAKILLHPSSSSQGENKRKNVASFVTCEFSKTSPDFNKERILNRALILKVCYEGKVVYGGFWANTKTYKLLQKEFAEWMGVL